MKGNQRDTILQRGGAVRFDAVGGIASEAGGAMDTAAGAGASVSRNADTAGWAESGGGGVRGGQN